MPEKKVNALYASPLTWIRRLTQTGMLAVLGQWSFYGIFRCPFAVPFVGCQVCPVITCWGRITGLFWGFWLLLPVSVILFGRAFCGWACPGGLVNQLIGKASIVKLRVRNQFMKIAPWGLFAGLIIALTLWLGINNPRWVIPIRVGEFWNSIKLTFEHAPGLWLARTLIVLGLAAAGLFIANLWCRFACPMGGLLELIKRVSIFRVFKTSACNDCDACLQVCEMGSRPDETNCTNCGDCLKYCQAGAIKIGIKRVNS
ncbi:MAG: 4Fe-4S binding protein [Acidobacteriota bacterium]|jgi:polyferredoxin|nr:4Fe-4S binding protein [Acidobacteriota bacterium]